MIRAAAIRMKNHARNCASLSRNKTSIDLRMPIECHSDDRILKGNGLIGGSSASSAHSDDRIAHLHGYLEALRSKVKYQPVIEEMKERLEFKRNKLDCFQLNSDQEVDPLPKVLPFPVETCNLVDFINLNSLPNKSVVRSAQSMILCDNAELILFIIRGLIYKLWELHYSGVIHGNLKPQNVLLFEGDCMLTSIINDGSDPLEWKAREQIIYGTQTKASDMFTFGCVLYFCITGGCHPFGDTPDERVQNIITNKMNISRIEDVADAYHLISRLLSPEPEARPKAHDVAMHPFFDDLRSKVELIGAICGIFTYHKKEIIDEVLTKAPIVGNPNWRSRYLAYSSAYGLSLKQPIEEFEKVFGPRGSPSFFPKIFMSIYEVTYKHYSYTRFVKLEEDAFPEMDEFFFRYHYCDMHNI